MINSFLEIENNNYLSSLVKDDNKFIYLRDIFNNVSIDNFEKIFNDHINNHNKKIDFYYINCDFQITSENKIRLLNIEINFHHNTDYINLKSYLFLYTESHRIKNFKINDMIINTISCLCNMTYKYYLTTPMSMLERRMNYIISKNPKLINCLILDRNKSHPLIRKIFQLKQK